MSFLTVLLYKSYSLLSRPFHCFNSSPMRLSPSPSPYTSPSFSSSSPDGGAFGSSLDPSEVSKFSAMSSAWWDVSGEFCLLHRMNPTRLSFIRQHVVQHFRSSSLSTLPPFQPFTSLTFLDVGCGGGLLSESLARLGARTTGIDASLPNIRIARAHAAPDPALTSLTYHHLTAEQLLSAPPPSSSTPSFTPSPSPSSQPTPPSSYDVVCSLEVVEHVHDPAAFTRTLANLVRPGGLLFISTINRTWLAWALTIGLAEGVLGWVGRGTHDWDKYVKVEELRGWVEGAEEGGGERKVGEGGRGLGMEVVDVNGMLYDPLSRRWSLDQNRTEVNYILCARRPS